MCNAHNSALVNSPAHVRSSRDYAHQGNPSIYFHLASLSTQVFNNLQRFDHNQNTSTSHDPAHDAMMSNIMNSEAQPPPAPSTDNTETMIKITIGGSKLYVSSGTRFRLPKDKLCDSSTFFRNALNGSWLEGSTNNVNLPDDYPHAFAVFAHWLEGKPLIPFKKPTGLIWNIDVTELPCLRVPMKVIITFMNAFLLSEKLQAPNFQQSVLKTMENSMDGPFLERIIYPSHEDAISFCLTETWSLVSVESHEEYVAMSLEKKWRHAITEIINSAYNITTDSSPLRYTLAAAFAKSGFEIFDQLIDPEKAHRDFLDNVRTEALSQVDGLRQVKAKSVGNIEAGGFESEPFDIG